MAPWKDWRSKVEEEEELQGNSLFMEWDITADNPWNEYWEPQRASDRAWELKDVDGYPLWMTKEYKMVMSWDDSGAQEARETKEAQSQGLLSELPDLSPDKYNDHIDWDVDVKWSSEAAAAWAYLAANKPDKPVKRRRGSGGRSWFRRDDDNNSGYKRPSFQQYDTLRVQQAPAAPPSGWSPPREKEPAAWPLPSRWSDEERKPASPPGLRWSPPRCQPVAVAQPRWPSEERYNSQGWSRPPARNERQQNQQRQRQPCSRWNNRPDKWDKNSRDVCHQPKNQYMWRPKQQQQQQQMPW